MSERIAAKSGSTSALALSVGTKIREFRKARGMTLLDLANKCGTTPQTMQRIEVAKMTISMEWIEQICDALAIEPAMLFGQAESLAKQISMCRQTELLRLHLNHFIEDIIDPYLGKVNPLPDKRSTETTTNETAESRAA